MDKVKHKFNIYIRNIINLKLINYFRIILREINDI
jgi:hypothetical protein